MLKLKKVAARWVLIVPIVLALGGSLAFCVNQVRRERGPLLVVDRPEVNLGVVRPKAKIRVPFKLTNAGLETITFGKPTTTCNCLKPSSLPQSLAPGQSTIINVDLKERDEFGPFLEWVSLPCNDPRTPTVRLTVLGQVWPPVVATPRQLSFSAIRVGDSSSQRVELTTYDGKPFAIRRVEFESQAFDLEFVPGSVAASNRILVRFRPQDRKAKLVIGDIVVHIDHPELRSVVIPVTAEVSDPIVAIPPRLLALFCEPEGVEEREFELEGPRKAPEVKSLECSEGSWKLEKWERKPSQSEHRLRVSVRLEAPDTIGYHQGKLTATCVLPDNPSEQMVVTIPFAGTVRGTEGPPNLSAPRETGIPGFEFSESKARPE